MLRLALPLTVLALSAVSPAFAGGWEPRYRAPSETVIVTERHERTEIRVRHEPRRPEQPCTPYIHAIWIHAIPVVDERLACVWPDGTIRDGRRPY